MTKGNHSGYTSTETWNIGKFFSNTHVLVPLIECRRLVKLALFGTEDITYDLNISPSEKALVRVNSLKRLNEELRQIIEDTTFCMDKANAKDLNDLKLKLQMIDKLGLIEKSYSIKSDQRTNTDTHSIKEDEFKKVLNKLREILDHLKKPLNNRNLIFPASESIDIDELQKRIEEGG